MSTSASDFPVHREEIEWASNIASEAERARKGEEKTFTQDDIDHELGISGKPVDMSVLDDID